MLGKREQDVRNGFELPSHLKMENMARYMSVKTSLKSDKESALAEYARDHKQNEIGWDIIPYIKRVSGLKVFAKGIMCAEDAVLAIEHGADGIYVSNHGARQLDTTPATIDVLPEVVQAVRRLDKHIPIYFDGGVRTGADVLKALAIGADCVYVGRPILWGLATDGQEGVERVLEILNQELKEAMLATGCMSVSQARGNPHLLYDKREYLFKL
jgi:(S)-2-hydroxy-acid oxidase